MDSNALCDSGEINPVCACGFCSARGFINAVVEYDMNEILGFFSHRRWKPAQIHQERSVAVKGYDSSLRQPEGHS
jgi:hypothetical protein